MLLKTPECSVCGEASQIEVEQECFENWMKSGVLEDCIDVSPEVARQIKSGVHPECWANLFG